MPNEGQGDLTIAVDPAQLKAMLAEIKEFDPELAKAVRKNLRQIGGEVAAAMKADVLKGPGSGGKGEKHNTRKEIAAGIGVKVSTAAKRQGVFVSGSAKKMAAGRAVMPRAYNKSTWRHPVFGTTRWVSQSGNPYFGKTIRRFEAQAEAAVEAALAEALKTVRTAS